jgi:LysR family transcriptional regulator (chromosome initiation inhibitor)
MNDIDYKSLKALTTVIQEGGFEKASHILYISQSAISQRIKLLEEQIGQVLLTRTSPPRPTFFGRRMIKHYQQVKMLEDDLLKSMEMTPQEGFTTFSVGINIDSLATWFLDAVSPFLKKEHVLLDLVVDNQELTHLLLRDGKVGGCISSRPEPLQGCRVEYLGSINYHLLCTPEFAKEWFPQGLTIESIHRAPILIYNRKDKSHLNLIRLALGDEPKHLTAHYLPTVEKFTYFISLGLACGMCDITADEACMQMLESGKLIDLASPHFVKLHLYWHSWNLRTNILDKFSKILVKEARKTLKP